MGTDSGLPLTGKSFATGPSRRRKIVPYRIEFLLCILPPCRESIVQVAPTSSIGELNFSNSLVLAYRQPGGGLLLVPVFKLQRQQPEELLVTESPNKCNNVVHACP